MTEPTALVHLVKVYYSDQDPELVDDPQYWLITWHLNEFNNLNFEVTDPTRGNEGDEPEDVAEGYLKWDGCLNITFDSHCFHFCGPEEKPIIGRLIEAIYNLGPEIKTWSLT